MDLIFLRNWIRTKATNVGLSYSEIETLFDVNDLVNATMPLLMFNYEQEENQYQESPFTTINLKIYLIQNFHDAVKTQTADYQRDYLVTQKNILRQHYLDFIENFQRDESPIIEIISDTQLQLAEKVSIEGFLIMEATINLRVERDFCLNVSGEPLPPACADATYIVKYEDDTIIQQGNIPSGGSVTVEVPDIIKDLTLIIPYSDGDNSATINIVADSNGTINTIVTTLINVLIEVNTTPVNVPFSISESDEVVITFDAASGDGSIKLEGGYV